MDQDPTWAGVARFWAIILVAIGAAILLFVRRRWAGRYRQWAVGRLGPIIVYLCPAAAAFCFAIALGFVASGLVVDIVVISLLALAIFGFFASIWEPRWWGPRWYHQVRHELQRPDMSAWVSLDYVIPAPGVSLGSGELADAVFDGQPPTARWNGYLVEEPNVGLRKYGVREVVERPGILELRPAGLAFIPGRLAERLGVDPFVLPISAQEVDHIRVVPAGADPDGLVRRGVQHVFHPRVVLRTERGTFLFSLPRAHERAKTIAETLGCALVT